MRPLTTVLFSTTAAIFAAVVLVNLPAPDAPPPAGSAARTTLSGPSLAGAIPQPTGHILDPDAEATNKSRRKAWFAQMHRAPPGVDYKAVDKQNGLDQIERRNQLTTTPPSPHDGAWVERGSDNQAGRVHVTRHAPDGTSLYVGSSKGGVWKADIDGTNWQPIADNLYGGAHWLEVVSPLTEGDPDIVLVATDGGMIHRTTDGGTTWEEPAGLPGSVWWVRRLIKQSDEDLYLLLHGDDGGALLRSEDAGASFTQLIDMGGYYGDLWIPRDGSDQTLYLLADSALMTSTDDGQTWIEAGILPQSSRGELTGSEAGGPRLWAVLDSSTLYRSDDAGETFAFTASVSDYWGSLAGSITDADRFAWGGVELWRTFDEGGSFSRPSYWWDYYDSPHNRIHADIPGIDVLPDGEGGEVWYINTDGGLFRSSDGLLTFENLSLSGLRVSQYYDVHTSSVDPDHIIAGAQDQGYQVTATISQKNTDSAYQFDQIISGDYGHLTSSGGTQDFVYSVYPGFILIQIGAADPALVTASFPGKESYGAWLPPVVADPDDAEVFYFCATRLYQYTRTSKWIWTGVPMTEPLVSGGDFLSALAFSPLDSDRLYTASANGKFFTSEDRGLTWRESHSLVVDDNWLYGQGIAASQFDVDTVYVAGSGYGVPAVYRSLDAGFSFEPWGQGLPDTLVYSIVEARDGDLYIGTESSAWRRSPDEDEWEDITAGPAPITTYWSTEQLTHEDTIRFGTYGRGIWDYQIPEPTPEDTGTPDTGTPQDTGEPPEEDTDPLPEDTQEPEDTADPPEEDDDKNCGCSAGPSGVGLLLPVLLAVAWRRR